MASLTIQCRTERVETNGYAPVRLRISHSGKRKFVSLDLDVLASKWNDERQRVTRSHPDNSRINARLSEVESVAQRAVSRLQSTGEVITAGRIQQAVKEELFGAEEESGYDDFIAFAWDEVKGYRRRDQMTTFRHYRTGVRKLLDFLEDESGQSRKDITLPFDALTVQLIREFRNHMYEVRRNAPNTVGKTLTQIKTIWNAAVKEGHADHEPWSEITIDSAPSQKEKLDFEEIEALEEVELPEGSSEQQALDYFLFALYGGGMRFSDVATLKHKHLDGGRIQYKMKKTSEGAGVPIVDKAKVILDRYDNRPQEPESRVFPILDGYDLDEMEDVQRAIESRNAYVNRQLKKVQEKAEIETNLTFHLARHSAAWKLYQEMGDIYKVKRILGHSRVEVTEEYLRGFPDTEMDEEYEGVF
ncbi:site-specific recombinase XerD [Salinibacter ruber]|uniref:site-specific integrase n=1 Tax=Salinibacter ruber TaxID=146919 RepID=UPI00216901F5|nr:site-specific integrase [Salinibacter ruber]MCS3668852.1 site-specific recombinase XerD [Salinibacter ruber]